MLDFLQVSTRSKAKGVTEIYPKFVLKSQSTDLMIRGGDFYAIWVEDRGLWSTNELDALRLIDQALDAYSIEHANEFSSSTFTLHMWDAENGMIDTWHKFCQKQCRDNFHMLDENLIFSNVELKKTDYASKRLKYPLEECPTPGWDKLMVDFIFSPRSAIKSSGPSALS